jgi:hypothetical protein
MTVSARFSTSYNFGVNCSVAFTIAWWVLSWLKLICPVQDCESRAKEKVVAKKTSKIKHLMEEIASLVKSYTELRPEQFQSALTKGIFSLGQGEMSGAMQIQMSNVLQQGDELTLWIDRSSMLFRRIRIVTSYEGNPMQVSANYAPLPGHQVYMAQAIVNYPARHLVFEIDNFNIKLAASHFVPRGSM